MANLRHFQPAVGVPVSKSRPGAELGWYFIPLTAEIAEGTGIAESQRRCPLGVLDASIPVVSMSSVPIDSRSYAVAAARLIAPTVILASAVLDAARYLLTPESAIAASGSPHKRTTPTITR